MNDLNDKTRVEYDPEIMWFDYQSLFDKTKKAVLDINCNIEINHTNFKHNICASNATGIKKNCKFLDSILSGNIDSIFEVAHNILNYTTGEGYKDVFFEYDLCIKNYCYLLAIVASFCDFDDENGVREEVIQQIGFYPKEFSYRNINKINYKEGVKVLLDRIAS